MKLKISHFTDGSYVVIQLNKAKGFFDESDFSEDTLKQFKNLPQFTHLPEGLFTFRIISEKDIKSVNAAIHSLFNLSQTLKKIKENSSFDEWFIELEPIEIEI